MTDFITYLKGKKSYIIAACMVILSGLRMQNYIDEQAYQAALALLAGAGLAALRAGVTNAVTGQE